VTTAKGRMMKIISFPFTNKDFSKEANMKKWFTKIGDHLIYVICESHYLMDELNQNFNHYKVVNGYHPDLTIKINAGYGVPFFNYEVEINKNTEKIIYRRADYLIEVDTEYKFATISVYDQLALKHALTNLYSSFIVYHQWGLLIHSSCAIENGKAHIFAGHSGAGKSTAAKLSYPRQLLSDEASLLKITENGVRVFNSPFRSELKAEAFNGNIELASVQILYQALVNRRVRIGKSDALLHLMDKVFFWQHSQEETKTIVKLITMLVQQVPVYELHFEKNNTFWELIS
jgi:hypothetical protein